MNPRRMILTSLAGATFCAAVVAGLSSQMPRAHEQSFEPIPGNLAQFTMVRMRGGIFEYTPPDGTIPRRVSIKPFWIGQTEVTWPQFDSYWTGLDFPDLDRSERYHQEFLLMARPSKPYMDPTWGFGHDGYPAITMTFHHAKRYCEWLSRKTRRKYRLPTEIEWEYACRAGGAAVGPEPLELYVSAWSMTSSRISDPLDGQTHRVATKKSNAWGLHDMLGNVWEWCTAEDGAPVLRGGSWRERQSQLQPRLRRTDFATLSISDPDLPKSQWWLSDAPYVGFRIVREE